MELQQFISNALVSITKGIQDANSTLRPDDQAPHTFELEAYQRDKEHGYVSFDVAVTVSGETTKGAGAGLNIQVANIGGKLDKKTTEENVSRLKFFVLPARNVQ